MNRDPKWTDEQWQAITARGGDILVAAAAGAGKTAVLVERIIGIIKEGVDVDRLLVVTFTNAAAAEMRERIRAALTKELAQNPQQTRLRQQLVLINRAAITTLHSFCLDLVRKHYYRLDLDPAFRVADETEIALLRQDVLDAVFETFYERAGEAAGSHGEGEPLKGADAEFHRFTALVDAYGGDRDDSPLQDIVLQLYAKALSQPWPEGWLKDILRVFQDAGKTIGDSGSGETAWETLPWFRALREEIAIDLAEVEGLLNRALRLCRLPGGPAAYADAITADLQLTQDLCQAAGRSWSQLYSHFQALAFTRAKAIRGPVDETLKKEVGRHRDQAKKKLTDLQKKYFLRPPQELVGDLERALPVMETLVEVVLAFDSAFQAAKREKRLVDFNDLERFCLRLLLDEAATPEAPLPSALARELKEHFAEVLTDEYQDTNTVQETLLSLVSQNNRFMVGDVKQSIYRFRLAEPGLFMEKYQRYGPYEMAAAGEARIDLAKNFRSRRNVVLAVNDLFRRIMTVRAGEMAYDRQAELVYGATFPELPGHPGDPVVELHLLQRQPDPDGPEPEAGGADQTASNAINNSASDGAASDADEDTGEREGGEEALLLLETAQYEARLAARRIRELIDEGMPVFDRDQGGYRPVCYRDIVILMRGTKGRADIFLEEFRAAGVPAYADTGSGYFEATEVSIMLSLLRVIDNPRQDIPLAALLRSPIFRFTGEEMARIRLAEPRKSFFDAIQAFLRQVEGAGGEAGSVPATSVRPNVEPPMDVAPIAHRLQEFLRQIDAWRTIARRDSLAKLIAAIYRETGYYDYAGAMPGGGQRQANLRALYDRARQYEATTFRGLFRFLRFIERLQDQGGDLGTARALGEKENVVRIMSIHKSKGLEFPVVFVVAMGNQFNVQDLRQDLLIHKNLGLGPVVVDTQLRYRYPTVAKLAIQRRLYRETLAEEMRILYVALTRAREKLILLGTVRDITKAAQQWRLDGDGIALASPLADQALLRAKCYLDWIGPALAEHPDGQEMQAWAAGAIAAAMEGNLPEREQKAEGISRWRLCFGAKSALTRQEAGKQTEIAVDPLWLAKLRRFEPVTSTERVEGQLAWQYPLRDASGIAAKVAVSRVKDRFVRWLYAQGEEIPESDGEVQNGQLQPTQSLTVQSSTAQHSPDQPPSQVTDTPPSRPASALSEMRPRFLQQERRLTAAERGTAFHLVMQHLDFAGDLSRDGIARQVDRLVERELLTMEQRKAVDEEQIGALMESPLGIRLRRAKQALREVPFTLALPVREVYPDKASVDDRVIVQGVIDCLFEEEDGWVLLDYKTDRRPSGMDSDEWFCQLREMYLGQVNLYHRAVETVCKVKVKNRHLFLIAAGREMVL
ncbi:UvrD-helicase domain-containing protein [Heliobacterium gestii]|uniref:ATP-dependent helicase/nuclease subunit A n=1 Tax=Heliomicrobium gestii TaxID=2699 RepID=A0A845LKT2_HELGE|nr:UvrD-helicase domain-containing protein [Heliomicrobium gestii]MBM7867609.1 ATP-dependent helicase/nuclease subunit A [Heliomicrobium gestii]MZP44003.1 UvrD-helicase domain-containing protein [Heliomicrobium gestii]